MIQTLEDMLRACTLEWKGGWDDHLKLAEFAYNNNYYSSIGMSPYEALYKQPCRTPLCWIKVGEHRELGPALLEEATATIELIRDRLKMAHDHQKKYADKKKKDVQFQVGDKAYLKLVTFKGMDMASKMGKLKPRYMGYRLDLPKDMKLFHPVFHVLHLRRVIQEPELVISQPPTNLRKDLSVSGKPIRVLPQNTREGRNMKTKRIQVI